MLHPAHALYKVRHIQHATRDMFTICSYFSDPLQRPLQHHLVLTAPSAVELAVVLEAVVVVVVVEAVVVVAVVEAVVVGIVVVLIKEPNTFHYLITP